MTAAFKVKNAFYPDELLAYIGWLDKRGQKGWRWYIHAGYILNIVIKAMASMIRRSLLSTH